MRLVAAARPLSLESVTVATVIVLALFIIGLDHAWGATACPQPVTAGQCPKPVKVSTKAAAVAAPAVTAESAAMPASWKSSLDPLTAGGWVLITDGPVDNPSVVYASTHNVLHNGNVVTAWVRWEYSRIQADVYPLHYQSAVTHEELDCDARSYRRAAVFYYRRNNLQDKALQFTALDDDTTWKLAIPGTEGDAMLAWACTPAARKVDSQKIDGKKAGDTASDEATEAPATKTTSRKSGAAVAAPSSAPSSAPAAVGGGTNLHTTR